MYGYIHIYVYTYKVPTEKTNEDKTDMWRSLAGRQVTTIPARRKPGGADK